MQMRLAKTVADEQHRREHAAEAENRAEEVDAYLESVHEVATQAMPVPPAERWNMDAAKRLLESLVDDGVITWSRQEGCALLERNSERLSGLVFGEPLWVIVEHEEPEDGAEAANGNGAQQNRGGGAAAKLWFGDSIGASGDGAHTRNTRANGIGRAPCTYVSIISTVTGAVLIQVCVRRQALVETREANTKIAAAKFPVTALSTNEERKAALKEQKLFIDGQLGMEYDFLGKKYYTNYVLSESAGLDLALQILRNNVGEHAMRGGLAYDELSSCATSLRKHMPDVPKIGDPWHLSKSMRAETESLESDKMHGGAFVGLKQMLFGSVRENFKNRGKSTEDKVAWIKGYKFPTERELTPVQLEAFEGLKTKIASTFETTRPGFATSMVESYWATHGAFWAKGLKYEFETVEMTMTFQALHWNRVENWHQKLFARVLPLMQKKSVVAEQQ
jgi:hypothetical protein